jgi:protocatechuate 3,4-dioxygenase beta subunit
MPDEPARPITPPPDDVSPRLPRRQALRFLGGAAVVAAAAACGGGTSSDTANGGASSSTTSPSSSASTNGGATTKIPEETAGPYPGDGSNGPDVLTQSGIVRSDIRSSFGDAHGTADGVPATLQLRVLDAATGAALNGAAVYVWHCDRAGDYSLYSAAAADQNYLRGVQLAGRNGVVTFTTIFPAAYAGRWPHIHFEVYSSLADATGGGTKLATSQLALPEATCKTVYATNGYEQSAQNLSQLSLASDMVFSDGVSHQLATVTGSVDSGYAISLDAPV